VTDTGFLYKSETYRSLSAAAMAAAKDLGVAGAQNGFIFWSLVKPAPRVTDPIEALQAAWERYHARVKAIAGAEMEGPVRMKVSNALDRQGREIIEVASTL
jgi:hypothetical protein